MPLALTKLRDMLQKKLLIEIVFFFFFLETGQAIMQEVPSLKLLIFIQTKDRTAGRKDKWLDKRTWLYQVGCCCFLPIFNRFRL